MTGMTAAEFGAVELVDDDAPEFFAPADTDMLDGLLGQYRHARAGVEEIAAFMASRLDGGDPAQRGEGAGRRPTHGIDGDGSRAV